MRKKLFMLIEPAASSSIYSTIYSLAMMTVIITSLVPLAFKQTNEIFSIIEKISTGIFSCDYLFRLVTADIKIGKGKKSFFIYPFTFMAIIDILAILPTFFAVIPSLRMLKIFRLFRSFRIFRAFKIIRYSKNIVIICNVIQKQESALLAVATLAVGYILISALIIFNVEPNTFDRFFDAIYWATVSLTTVGYGDIFPVTAIGRIVAMLSSFIGIAIVALPAGIITAGYMGEIRE